jgi:crotonobetainyl-CoA:carnitine CoA-transferase CaiB-like acyl-CoA transferase
VIPSLTTFLGAMAMGLTNLRDGNHASGGVIAPYNAYPASDGWVMILANNNARWTKMCGLMGQPELATDDRFGGLMLDRSQLARPNEYYHQIHPSEAAAVDAHLAGEKAKADAKAKAAADAAAAKAAASAGGGD